MNKFDTLLQLLKPDFAQLSPKTLSELESTEEFSQLREKIREELPKSDWQLIRGELLRQVERLLDIPIAPILVESWKTHQDVEREILHQQQNPDQQESAIVTLDEHEIRSTHTPNLKLSIGDEPTGYLRIFIGTVFELKNVVLKIEAGQIVEIVTAQASGNGFMQYQNATLVDKDFLLIDLAGMPVPTPPSTAAEHQQAEAAAEPSHGAADDDLASPAAGHDSATSGVGEVTSTSWIPTQEKAEDPQRAVRSNMIQFMLGISIALLAVFLFWQLK